MPVRVEHEHLVEALDVLALLGRKLDASRDLAAALVRSVHLGPRIDVEGEVLQADLVVAGTSAVGGAQPEVLVLLPDAEIDHLLRAAVGGEPLPLTQSERSEYGQIERQRSLHIADGEVDMLDPQST